ncbi:hypothetical protein [Paraburkholderia ferrariae]|jgi:hypothetical protein|uniref:hypothetical protein n=1 Tax=Paraburkholderia ferrariae TaxID=386056 RepID=UPI0004817FF8|nr:hypothetical protein [Paraburkholderia ferrariae]
MKMLKNLARLLALASLQIASVAHAGLVNDVPSCYGAFHLKAAPQPPDHLVYVLIDQTVLLDPNLQQSVLDNLDRMIQPGSKFVIAEFSAFSQGHYLDVLHTGVVEQPLPDDAYGAIPIQKAPQIKACFGQQLAFARKMAATTAKQVMQASTSSLNESEIMGAVSEVGLALRADQATNKVLFLVSDGLENSRTTSFYAHNTVRDINPAAELAKAKSSQMYADLAGAKVYVLGGAMMPPATMGTRAQRDGYRDSKTVHDLKTFWQGYFDASHAQLAEFGAPALVTPVSY